jgi:hypothetical protein
MDDPLIDPDALCANSYARVGQYLYSDPVAVKEQPYQTIIESQKVRVKLNMSS